MVRVHSGLPFFRTISFLHVICYLCFALPFARGTLNARTSVATQSRPDRNCRYGWVAAKVGTFELPAVRNCEGPQAAMIRPALSTHE